MIEEELIKECKSFNPLAQKELYEQFGPFLLGICIRYCGNKEEGEDLLHEGFVKILSRIKQLNYKGSGSLKAWMQQIMINTSLDYIKEKNKRNKQTDILPDTHTNNEYLDNNLKELDKKDVDQNFVDYGMIEDAGFNEEELLTALNDVPDSFRIVFNLHIIDGMKHEEIAKQLGIDTNTSRSRLLRARKMLQERLFKMSIDKLTK